MTNRVAEFGIRWAASAGVNALVRGIRAADTGAKLSVNRQMLVGSSPTSLSSIKLVTTPRNFSLFKI